MVDPLVNTARVSVVIPTFNGGRFVQATLEAILSQTLLPSDIIVVDDASTDDTLRVVSEVAKSATVSIRTLVLKENTGSPSVPMNCAIRSTQADFISIVDQDDLILPTKLQDEVQALCANSDAVFAGSGSAKLGGDECQSNDLLAEIRKLGTACAGGWILDSNDMLRLLLERGCFLMGFPGFTFRKTAWEDVGGIDESMRIADHDFLCRLSTVGTCIYLDRVNYLRRIHDRNVSRDTACIENDYVRTVRKILLEEREKWLGANPDRFVRQALPRTRGALVGIGYKLRDRGSYRDAWSCFRTAGAVWGWRRDLIQASTKLAFLALRAGSVSISQRVLGGPN